MHEIAIQAALRAGEIQRQHYGTALHVDAAKRNDIKLEVDRLCETAILETIHAAYPDHAILAEEGGARHGTAPYRWIVDPLDGTVNFFYGIPYFCTCVACYRQGTRAASAQAPEGPAGLGEPVVGVVYAPLQDELFMGIAGQGATLNGQPIHASPITALAEAVLAIGFGSTPENIHHMRAVTGALVPQARKLRCFGSAGYDMANVAAGRITGYYERGIRSWDVGAPFILLQEAGAGLAARPLGEEAWEVLAAAPGIHAALAETVRAAQP